jgi:hypothetical protein
MSVRAYMLLDIVEGNCEHAVQMLRSRSGVVSVDWLEGRPDIIVMVEAPNRLRLAEAIMPVIGCVDGITEDLHLMVSRVEYIPEVTQHLDYDKAIEALKEVAG